VEVQLHTFLTSALHENEWQMLYGKSEVNIAVIMDFMVFWIWYVGTNISVKLVQSSGSPKKQNTLQIETKISSESLQALYQFTGHPIPEH
jgi:hypothetical protein